MSVAAVVIGRNEGARLVRCLASLEGQVAPIVYVDSGSTDGSVAAAKAAGADVVALDMSRPFTAARARNAGLARLDDRTDLVQTIDGDCTLHPGWIDVAEAAMTADETLVAVAGRLREERADATIWTRLADAEWTTPPGETEAVGGIALWRRAAIETAGGFREDLIAGEEPELCLRLRRAGGRIRRLEADMGWHDIAMTRFGQWWRRTRRAGFASAEGMALHGRGPERYRIAETRRAVFWGAALPLSIVIAGFGITPWAFLGALAYPAQIWRLARRGMGWERAFFLTLGKFAEAQGVLEYGWSRIVGRQRGLIEYK